MYLTFPSASVGTTEWSDLANQGGLTVQEGGVKEGEGGRRVHIARIVVFVVRGGEGSEEAEAEAAEAEAEGGEGSEEVVVTANDG